MRARVRLALAAMLMILVAGLGTSPALAHANVVGSKPAVDARLATAPAEVSVTFDATLLDMGAAMVVRRDDGTVVSVGTPQPSRRQVSIAVDPAAGPGHYTVAFRVTTEDGHAIEATYGYTVAGASPASAGPSAAPSDSATGPASTAGMEPAPSGSPMAVAVQMTHAGSGEVPVVAITVGAFAFIVLAVAGAVFQRRRA